MIGTVGPDKFENLIKTGEYEVIDIRTQQEVDYFGIIPGTTKHLDVYTKVDEILSLDKNKKYLIYCYHGNRTAMLLQYMKEIGFKEVIDLEGGIENWLNSGRNLLKLN